MEDKDSEIYKKILVQYQWSQRELDIKPSFIHLIRDLFQQWVPHLKLSFARFYQNTSHSTFFER